MSSLSISSSSGGMVSFQDSRFLSISSSCDEVVKMKMEKLAPDVREKVTNVLMLLKRKDTQDLTPKEFEAINVFLKDILNRKDDDPVVDIFYHMAGAAVKEFSAYNISLHHSESFIMFVVFIRKEYAGILEIQKTMLAGKKLTFDEVYRVDCLRRFNNLINTLHVGGITDSEHINKFLEIQAFISANMFKDYENGDVLFTNSEASSKYNACGTGKKLLYAAAAFGTNTTYAHAGVFYRDNRGNPYIIHVVNSGFVKELLFFGEQSIYRAKRINVAKLVPGVLNAQQSKEAHSKFQTQLMAAIAPEKKWKLHVSGSRAAGCWIGGHTKSTPNNVLGAVRIIDNTETLCTEYIARGIMQAIATYNIEIDLKRNVSEEERKQMKFCSPFDPKEKFSKIHPGRLLCNFGPNQGTAKADSAWVDVMFAKGEGVVDISAIMPDIPAFPAASYAKPKAA